MFDRPFAFTADDRVMRLSHVTLLRHLKERCLDENVPH